MLEIRNLSKTFKGLATPVLQDVSMQVESGQFCIILGSNGSGKSTLLKCITGEQSIDLGSIALEEKQIQNLPIYKRAVNISSVSQDTMAGTASDMTVLENMVISYNKGKSASFGSYQKFREECLADLSTLGLGLEKLIDHKMSLLSGGQRQSIATLMAFKPLPKLLLLDEHTSAIDPRGRKILMDYTNEQIRRYKTTTLMVTHNLEEAVNFGDRLLIMQHGMIVFDVKEKAKQALTAKDIIAILHQNDDFSMCQNL